MWAGGAVQRLQGGQAGLSPLTECATHASIMLQIKNNIIRRKNTNYYKRNKIEKPKATDRWGLPHCRPERNEAESNGSIPITRRRSILCCKCYALYGCTFLLMGSFDFAQDDTLKKIKKINCHRSE